MTKSHQPFFAQLWKDFMILFTNSPQKAYTSASILQVREGMKTRFIYLFFFPDMPAVKCQC